MPWLLTAHAAIPVEMASVPRARFLLFFALMAWERLTAAGIGKRTLRKS